MFRSIYTHTRDIYVEVMKKRIRYHIPTYGEGEVLKVLSIQRKPDGFILELERNPTPNQSLLYSIRKADDPPREYIETPSPSQRHPSITFRLGDRL